MAESKLRLAGDLEEVLWCRMSVSGRPTESVRKRRGRREEEEEEEEEKPAGEKESKG